MRARNRRRARYAGKRGEAGASAVAAGIMFHFTEQTPAKAKQYLAAAGVSVRQNYIACGA